MKNKELPVGMTRMLPHAWKTVGFIVAAAAFVAIFVAAFAFRSKIWAEYCAAIFIIGLFVAAISRDRHEDEMLKQMRFAAFFSAFTFGVMYPAIMPFVSLVFSSDNKVSGMIVSIMMLWFYHFVFYAMKRRARREKHD